MGTFYLPAYNKENKQILLSISLNILPNGMTIVNPRRSIFFSSPFDDSNEIAEIGFVKTSNNNLIFEFIDQNFKNSINYNEVTGCSTLDGVRWTTNGGEDVGRVYVSARCSFQKLPKPKPSFDSYLDKEPTTSSLQNTLINTEKKLPKSKPSFITCLDKKPTTSIQNTLATTEKKKNPPKAPKNDLHEMKTDSQPRTIPVKTEFENALRIKEELLSKLLSQIGQVKPYQDLIVNAVISSTNLLKKPLKDRENNSRLPGLELNLTTLKDLKKDLEEVKRQEEIIRHFPKIIEEFKSKFRRLTEKTSTSITFSENTASSSIENLSETQDEILLIELKHLEKEWAGVNMVFQSLTSLMNRLQIVSETLKNRVEKHAKFTVSTSESISPAKVTAITEKAKEI